ncbi:MAG: glycosyltransferase family 4 protein, partial [Gammaproteobacteria bacterium]|nr:glycosyltransferase family 4 protein [Gammaproteobacteria bacterium]NIW99088.1 glycosyltransferase [Phycisphaerae bacterium]
IVLEESTPESIAEALKFLYQHPVERNLMGTRGKERVRADWHWERMQSDLLDFYSQIYQWRKEQS